MSFDLPPTAGPARDTAILAHVRALDYEASFAPVVSSIHGHTATFQVFGDALKIGGVRINASASLQQTIADLLSCSMLTAKLADLRWAQRTATISPLPRAITDTTAAMVDQSAKVDLAASVTPWRGTGVLETSGKHWVIDNLLAQHAGRACNYGWFFEGPSFMGQRWDQSVTGVGRLIQGRGWAHDMQHCDYSQDVVLVSRRCVVDGQPRDLWDVLRDPSLAPLASAQGVVSVLRQPGVPVSAPVVA